MLLLYVSFSHKPCLFYNKYQQKSPVFFMFFGDFSVAVKSEDPEIFPIGFQGDRAIFHGVFNLTSAVFQTLYRFR